MSSNRSPHLLAVAVIALGAIALTGASCGPTTPKCGPATCAGCCDSLGKCQAGNLTTTCGLNGNTCSTCFANQTCALGVCAFGGAGGGSATGGGFAAGGGSATGGGFATGGGTAACNGQSCPNGCCEAGQCFNALQQSGAACGSLGNPCVPCADGFSCNAGVCRPMGAGGGSAGTGGGGAATCNFNTCSNGCCLGSLCIPASSQNSASCGLGGASCSTCGNGQTCTNGTCTGGSTGCGPQTCVTGCCNNGVCVPRNAQIASSCGTGGATCAACPTGNSCINGACTPPTTQGAVGESCSTVASCSSSIGSGVECRQTTRLGSGTYPGGYCTKVCNNQSNPCPSGSTCTSIPPTLGEVSPMCLTSCNPQLNDCRTGYTCYELNSPTNGVCFLDNPPTDVNPGRPADKVGNSCTSNTQCQSPPDAPLTNLGFCVPQTLPDGGLSGYTGGYCSADCTDFGQAICGNGSTCVGFSDAAAYCYASCPAPWAGQSTCRQGYVCSGLVQADGGAAPSGFCDTSCKVAGAACGAGSYCDAGYCLAP